MRSPFSNDRNWLLAGLITAILAPILMFGLGTPLWLTAVLCLAVFAGLVLTLAPRRLFEGIGPAAASRNQVEFARQLLEDAVPATRRLYALAGHISDTSLSQRVTHLAVMAEDVVKKVEANPAHAPIVRRFLNYYLPRSAEIVHGYIALQNQHGPDVQRLGNIRSMIGKLEDAFEHYADSLVESDLRALDTDLRLIDASLKEDLGRP